MPLQTYTPDMYAGLAFISETNNQSIARTKLDLSTTPARSVTIQALNLASSTVKRVFVVANAVSDSEATTKLGLAGQRFVVQMGGTLTLAFAEAVSRIDLIADVSETGTNCVVVTAIGS